MRKTILAIFVILILAGAGFAQENMGARPIGMGGAFTGLADDVNAIFVNPAGIGYLKGEMASVSTKISEGKEYTVIGGVEDTSFGTFGIGYIGASHSLDDTADTTYLDEGETPVKALNQTLVLSYARELNEFMVVPRFMGRLSIGTNLKFSSCRVSNAKGLSRPEGSSVNADVAAVFKPNENLSWGLNLKNLVGEDAQASDEQSASGVKAAMGISGNLLNKSLVLSAEEGCLGLEWRPVSGLALRLGRDGEYNTAGFGININGFGVDYGYMEKEEPIHYVAVSVAIERPEPSVKQASLDLQ